MSAAPPNGTVNGDAVRASRTGGRRRGGRRAGGAGAVPAVLAMLAAVGACGAGDGPEEALDEFAQAINRRDDEAVRRLVCEASRGTAGRNTLADPFAGSPLDVDRVDRRLRDLRYVATADGIARRDDDEATGRLSIATRGIPEDLSADARQVLDSMVAPFPVGLAGQDGTVTLVRQGGRWSVCAQPAQRSTAAAPARAVAALQFRPVLADRDPRVTAAPPSTGSADVPAADLQALARAGCTGRSPAAGRPADQPLVACSATGDEAFLLGPVEVSGDDLAEADAAPEPGNPARWTVRLTTSAGGRTRMADTTRRLSTQQPPRNRLAVVVDGVVLTAPAVHEPITGGELRIGGTFTESQAQDLVARITGRSPS